MTNASLFLGPRNFARELPERSRFVSSSLLFLRVLIDHTGAQSHRSRTRLRLCRRQIAICLCIFRRPRRSSLSEGFGRRQDLPLWSRFYGYQKQFHGLSLSHLLFLFPSLFLSLLSPFSLQAWRRSTALLSSYLPCASSLPLRFRSRGNLQELLEMDRPAGWKPRTDFTRGIYANNRGNYVSRRSASRFLSSAHNQREIILGTVAIFCDESARASHCEFRLFNGEIMLGMATDRNWTIFFKLT